MKLLLIGPINGPKGGVNIHMNRLRNLLKNEFEIDVIDESKEMDGSSFNIRSKNIFKYFQLIKNSDLVHIHSNQWWLRIFHIIWSSLFLKKSVVTIHSFNFWAPSYQKTITNVSLSLVNKVIIVSEEIKELLTVKNTILLPAFLPPQLELETPLPNDVLANINEDYKIVVANASQLFELDQGELYGFDLCLELARLFKENNQKIRIIFVVTTDNSLLQSLKVRINEYGLSDHFVLIEKSISFVNLILNSDLVLRPTAKDGDAITVREALFLNKPVLASDIVKRPEGTYLFKNRDLDDLYINVVNIKSNLMSFDNELNSKNFYEIYKNIYFNLTNEENR